MDTNDRAAASAKGAVSGRHTLGSLPESQEPLDPAALPSLPPIPPDDNLTDGAEPSHTIYAADWYAARERVDGASPGTRPLLVSLLDVVEAGWLAVRELQHWYDANSARARQDDAYGHLLAFVDGDVVDLYREVARGVAELVPGWAGWESDADPDDVAGDVITFVRYLAVLNLAVQVAEVPESFAVLVASVEARLHGWGTGAAALITKVADRIWRT